jgi:hypothetical protein
MVARRLRQAAAVAALGVAAVIVVAVVTSPGLSLPREMLQFSGLPRQVVVAALAQQEFDSLRCVRRVRAAVRAERMCVLVVMVRFQIDRTLVLGLG